MRILGHRGARGEAPENSVAGFIYAKELGLDAVEFDVRMARDGELVVIHDATLDRTTNATGNVSEFTSRELAALDARAGFNQWPLPCGVPTLNQVLDVVETLPTMQLEIKKDTPERLEQIVAQVIDTIETRKMVEQVIVTSFDPVALEILRRIRPDYPVYSLLGTYDTMEWLDRATALGCRQINVSIPKASAQVVERAHELGLSLGGWGCNTLDAPEKAKALQLGSFTHDFPSQLLPLMNAPT